MYNVGDRVKIVNKWSPFTLENDEGRMDHWLGQVMTIIKVSEGHLLYTMAEDQGERPGGWCWNEFCIEGLAGPAGPEPDADDLLTLL